MHLGTRQTFSLLSLTARAHASLRLFVAAFITMLRAPMRWYIDFRFISFFKRHLFLSSFSFFMLFLRISWYLIHGHHFPSRLGIISSRPNDFIRKLARDDDSGHLTLSTPPIREHFKTIIFPALLPYAFYFILRYSLSHIACTPNKQNSTITPHFWFWFL